MALRSGFFNSINGDRVYHTGHWAEYFASFIGNGVFPNPSNNLQVASNNNMTITIKPGKAWINGYILINDSDYQLSLTPADGVLNRIDRIVARYDTVARAITLEVKQGAFASSPVAPALQRNADGYELALADVRINAGVISITQANITDTRLNKDLCGIVHGVVEQVDTTTIFDQYQAWFNDMKDGAEQEVTDWQQQQHDDFMIWFQFIQDVLDGDVAGNLLNLITQLEDNFGSLQSDFSAHQADIASQEIGKGADIIGLPDPDNLFTATNIGGAMNELFTNVSDGKSLVGGAITDVDDSVVIPTDPTFGDLADAIGGISTGKKWASGVTGNVLHTMDINGLSFKPSFVMYYIISYVSGMFTAMGIATIERDIYYNGVQNNMYISFKNGLKYTVTESTAIFGQNNVNNLRVDNTISTSYKWIAFE